MFKDFKIDIQNQFNKMSKHNLFRVDVEKDLLWETYLNSFPEGSNPIFRERTEHDCQCCKSFIRAVGDMVAIIDNKVVSLWDVTTIEPYQTVTNALSNLIKSKAIDNVFFHFEKTAGTDKNYQSLETGETLTWEHFYLQIPNQFVKSSYDIGGILSNTKSTRDVFYRSLSEVTLDSIDTVLELIAQNSLYRGEENKFAIEEFRKFKIKFDKLKSKKAKDIFCWNIFKNVPTSVSKIRGTAIGTLLVDLSEGKDLEHSVKSFESKVAPTNYKRPTALITKSMIDKAQKTVEELGFTSALSRRFAVTEDITINNVLFANREAKKIMNVFDELSNETKESSKKFDKVEEVNIETFINNILPSAKSIELMFENQHINNLVSLIAPANEDSKNMLKWHNNFSWTYNGEVTDSIKQRVKNAGGRVDGYLRCSLSWYNGDDLDIHMYEPKDFHIYYGHKISNHTGGNLDVDMNAGRPSSRKPVENICYPSKDRLINGTYEVKVHNYNKRERKDEGFEVEMEFDGKLFSFHYDKPVKNNEYISVIKFTYSKSKGVEIINSLPSTQVTKEVWGLNTQKFHNVSMVMYSPNHWDEKATGNRHYFFMLENCINDTNPRGFFNEFLTDDLKDHRKVFEVLGSKMKVEATEHQLSGLGFSSTQRNNILCRVKGNFNRVIKITF